MQDKSGNSAAPLADPADTFERQPNEIYKGRRDRLGAKLGKDALLIFAGLDADLFRQDNDFYYLTGWTEPSAVLLVTEKKQTLYLPGRNPSQEIWTGPKLSAESPGIHDITGFDSVEQLDKLRDDLVAALPSTPFNVFTAPGSVPIQWLQRANAFPTAAGFVPVGNVTAPMRLIKDDGELALLRSAARATAEGLNAAARAVKPGVSENEIAAVIQFEYKRRGCQASSFPSIVASGLNATVLHYTQDWSTLQDGDVVVMDVGGEYSMYAGDVTRTLPVNGKFTPRQREIYDIVLGAHIAARDAFKLGVSTIGRNSPNSLHRVAFDYINTHGKDLHGQPLGQYFPHGTSHYVGLAVHDVGDNTKPLEPGTVFTIEPGVYIREERIGVRIEDTYAVKADGTLECLSCNAPK